MKKVIILAAILTLVMSGMAFAASVVGSKHDLTSATGGGSITNTGTDQVCVFCHTPHAGRTDLAQAPLWNRANGATTWVNDSAYSTPTLNGTSTTASAANALSAVCLGCHDGNVGDESLSNYPGSGNTDVLTGNWSPGSTFSTIANLNDGVSLQNDHPIGIAVTGSADTGINTTPDLNNVRLYSGNVECASCHNPHDNGSFPPFLYSTNAGSAMCTTCHIK